MLQYTAYNFEDTKYILKYLVLDTDTYRYLSSLLKIQIQKPISQPWLQHITKIIIIIQMAAK